MKSDLHFKIKLKTSQKYQSKGNALAQNSRISYLAQKTSKMTGTHKTSTSEVF